ncbi:PAS domain S-box protein [bacterium]|nr:PAS domain S-box protein [bacterium]
MDEKLHLPADPLFLIPMVDSLDAGFTVVDGDGKFQIWNEANTKILGKGAAVGLAPEEWAAHYGLHCPIEQRLLRHDELPLVRAMTERRHVEQEVILLSDALPEGRWIKVTARPLYNSKREMIGGAAIVRDVTHEKTSLLASQMMNAFFKSSDDGVIGLNMEGQVLLWSPGAERLLGWSTDEMIGQSIFCLLPAVRHREIHSLYEKARIEQDLPPQETSVLHKQGHLVVVSRSITAMRDSQGRTIGGIVVARDISRLKRAEVQLEDSRHQLRLLSIRQQNLLEQQLRALARELHDEFGQQLAAMKFELAWLERHLAVDHPQLDERLESLNQLLDSTIAGLRRVSRQMRPPLLEELGLCHALEALLDELSGRYGLKTSYECGIRHLSFGLEAALAVYRIVQEALTNVVRHSGASEVAVSLLLEDENLILRVSDNGSGVASSGTGSFGILGMQERARHWSGEVKVLFQQGGGTLVQGIFPVANLLAGAICH